MQVFIPYTNLSDIAACLFKDKRRYNKQIIECGQIIAAITGESGAWSNHPIVHQYRPYLGFLRYYKAYLEFYREGAAHLLVNKLTPPPFVQDHEYLDSHKKRLYQKNPKTFPEFAEYNSGDMSNLYCVPLDFAVPKRKGVNVIKECETYKMVKYDNRTAK